MKEPQWKWLWRSALAVMFAASLAGPGNGQLPETMAQTSRPSTDQALATLTRKEPYLILAGDSTRMKVLWQLAATETCTIEWRTRADHTAGSAATEEYGPDHQHTFDIPGLTPRTECSYRVSVEGESLRGSFWAVPPVDNRLKFVAYGDTRSYPSVHDQVAGAIVATYEADPGYQTFALLSGDLVNDGTRESDWTDQLFSPAHPNIRKLMANMAFNSCMGNHERTGILFMKYFPYPFVADRYWSFDYGPAHVAILDQYTDYGPGSAQLQWLTTDLATSSRRWKFICLHEPGWSAGGGHANNPEVQAYIQPLCEQYGVSIIFGGHNHYYARAVVNGVQHITTGGGGAPLHVPDPSYPHVVAAASEHHFCKVAISESGLVFAAQTPAGAVLDTFSLTDPAWIREQWDLREIQALSPASPNPFTKETEIRWTVPPGALLRLVIYDLAGRKVRSFPPMEPGRHTVWWDGRDDEGRLVETGIYFYETQPRRTAVAGKLVRLR